MLSASAFMTDTVTWRAFRFGQLLATEAATSLDEWYDRLAAVTAEDVRAAAESGAGSSRRFPDGRPPASSRERPAHRGRAHPRTSLGRSPPRDRGRPVVR